MFHPAGFLVDLDGTLYRGDQPVPGAAQTIAILRQRGVPFLLVTNTSSRSRAAVAARLQSYGISAGVEELMTAPLAAATMLRERGHQVVAPFLNAATLSDLDGMELVGGTATRERGAGSGKRVSSGVTAVLIGDLGRAWNYDLLQEAYGYLRDGAELIACSRDRVYRAAEGLVLDAGPFVAALEYASGISATIAGKPSTSFYRAAVARLGLPPAARAAMIGDDLQADIRGAQDAGCEGWLVLTGKTSRGAIAESGVRPDRVLESIADLETELAERGARPE